jgi:hypothetical protein
MGKDRYIERPMTAESKMVSVKFVKRFLFFPVCWCKV